MKLKNNFIKITGLLFLNAFVCADVLADIKFVPASSNTDGDIEDFRAPLGNECNGYTLVSPECEGKKCAQGWVCYSCTNNLGTFYKCKQARTPVGYTAGLTSCEPCNEYIYHGFTGNLINGRCIPITDCEENAGESAKIPFQYVNGVEVGDTEILHIEKTGYGKNAH